jgi:hypothetical protein
MNTIKTQYTSIAQIDAGGSYIIQPDGSIDRVADEAGETVAKAAQEATVDGAVGVPSAPAEASKKNKS